MTRRGGWIQTYTGRAFWPMDPQVEDIDTDDIAHALSMLCRFGGHSIEFYSVAEHCVLMSHAVSRENALWALLHDATEAYLVDVPRPIKQYLSEYRETELALSYTIAARFGLPYRMPDEVKQADQRILFTERQALLKPPPQPWAMENTPPLEVTIQCWPPHVAKYKYLRRLVELTSPSS